MASALATLLDRQAGRALVIVLSDFYDDEGVERLLARVDRRRCEAVFVQIAAPDERDPALRGEVTLVDAETGLERRTSVSSSALDAYRERYTRWVQMTERRCRERGVRWISVSSTMAFEDVVLDVFRVGGLLG